MHETVEMTDRVPISLGTKLNPLWWLQGPDGFTAPAVNNGAPYLPGVTNQALRDLLWWLRNPAMNLVGFVLGLEDDNYRVTGSAPVLKNTGKDCDPVQVGWRWAVLSSDHNRIGGRMFFFALFMLLGSAVHDAFFVLAAIAWCKAFVAPFVSYYRPGVVEFYMGWRPSSGGFGAKIVKG